MISLDVDRAIGLINTQIGAIEREQTALLKPGAKKTAMSTSKLTSQVMTLARGMAALLAEMRKTGADLEEQLLVLPPERMVLLAKMLVDELAPEHQADVGRHIAARGGKLISHG